MGGSGNKKPLLSDSDTDVGGGSLNKQEIQLYDDAIMLQMKKTICQGYITLLTGGIPIPEQAPKKKKSKKAKRSKDGDDPAVVLAFAALTTGNVIDVCFGVTMASKPSPTVVSLIKDAKRALFAADDASENAAKLAVEAYRAAFQTIIRMNDKLDKLNIFTKCFNEGKIRKQTSKQLEADFYMLEQILADNK